MAEANAAAAYQIYYGAPQLKNAPMRRSNRLTGALESTYNPVAPENAHPTEQNLAHTGSLYGR